MASEKLTPREKHWLRAENKTLTGYCDTASDAAYDLAQLVGMETKGAVYGELIAMLPEIVRQLRWQVGAIRGALCDCECCRDVARILDAAKKEGGG